MFPIRNAKGLVIGFGARTMNGDEQPKYLNSPETPVYHKGSELYGYFEGREAIYGKGRAIVCEDYMDVIQLSQAGFEEGARLEVRKAFIELERTKARIEMLAHDAARDMDAMRRLNDRRAELQRLADEARLAEREYRLRIENQARFESQRAAEKPWGGESAPFRPIRSSRSYSASSGATRGLLPSRASRPRLREPPVFP